MVDAAETVCFCSKYHVWDKLHICHVLFCYYYILTLSYLIYCANYLGYLMDNFSIIKHNYYNHIVSMYNAIEY